MKELTSTEVQVVSGSGAASDIGKAIGEVVGAIGAWIANASDGDPLGGAYNCGKTGVGCSG